MSEEAIRRAVKAAQDAAQRLSECSDTDALRQAVDALWGAGWRVKRATQDLDAERASQRQQAA